MGYIETAAARKEYRTITPEVISEGYSPLFSDPVKIKDMLTGTLPYSRERLLTKNLNLKKISLRAPEIVTFYHLIGTLVPDRIINNNRELYHKFIEIGKILVNSGDCIGAMNSFPSGFQTTSYLQLGIVAAFTPYQQRKDLDTRPPPFLAHEITTIVQNTPDLSQLPTPKERFGGITGLLTLTHEEAIAAVCNKLGIPSNQLKTLKETDYTQWKGIHRVAGELLTKSSFYGILTGTNNIFAMSKEREKKVPQNTDTGHCPAQPFVKAWLEGLGHALQKNEDAVLEAITTW